MLKYLEIFEDLKEKIISEVYKHGQLLPTEKEIVEQYNVSRTTVQKALELLVKSNYINRHAGKGSFVNMPTNLYAFKQIRRIAIILPNKRDPMFLMMQGAQSYLKDHGFELIACFYEPEKDDFTSSITQLNIEGVILCPLYPSFDTTQIQKDILMCNMPLVTMDMQLNNNIQTNNVCANNYDGGYKAAQYLMENGHSDIAIICKDINFSTAVRDRVRGFTQALQDDHIKFNSSKCLTLKEIHNSFPIILDFLNKIEMPTAIYCTNDAVAAKTYQVLSELKLSVPADVSIIGYDNIELSSMLYPPLTTIEQPYYDIGTQAAKTLINILSSDLSIVRIQLPVKLIVRDSVRNITKDKDKK